MIKANELRIGNWVAKSGKWYQLNINNFIEYLTAAPEPIPLTHGILEKAGIYKQTDKTVTGFSKYCGKDMMLLVDDWENPFSNIEVYYERHLTIYECLGQRRDLKLHQLQNLYFALTGEELEINL